MSVTEKEAKTKWCPFARNINAVNAEASYNRFRFEEVPTKCLGSACMAWRWRTQTKDEGGYCGLAGQP